MAEQEASNDLSIQDLTDFREELFSSTILEDNIEDYSELTTHSCLASDSRESSQESESQASISTCGELESQSAFKKIPELAKFFTKKRLREGGIKIHCQACSKEMRTTQMDRLGKHATRCLSIPQQDKLFIAQRIDEALGDSGNEVGKTLTRMWVRVMVENNYSLRSTESESFRAFFRYALPYWRIPPRQYLASKYVAAQANEAEREFRKYLKMQDSSLSVEFDHWLDGANRSLLGVIITYGSGLRYVCDLIDVSLEGHGSSVIVEKINLALKEIDASCINSFISDSASTCKSAREQLVLQPQFRHVIQHRCLAHLINRIGDNITKSEHIAGAVKWAARVASTVANSPAYIAKLKAAGYQRINSLCIVRWYSYVDMLESVLAARVVIVEEFGKSTAKEHRDLVSLDEPWDAVEKTLEIMRPLARCIAIAERKDGRLGEAFKNILDLGKTLFAGDWNNPMYLSTITAYVTYICPNKLNNSEFGVLLAAYALDPRYSLDFLTDDAQDLVLETITKLAINNGFKADAIKQWIAPEFASYVIKSSYPENQQDIPAADWWMKKRDSGALRLLALKLANLRSSSANIERTFSSLKYIQGSNRHNLSLETFVHLARAKIAMQSEEESFSDCGDVLERANNMFDLEENEQDELEADEVIVEASDNTRFSDNYRPSLLSRRAQRDFSEFSRYIDFSILSDRRAATDSGTEVMINEKDIEEIVSKTRHRLREHKLSRALE